jgi:hypothetical protein
MRNGIWRGLSVLALLAFGTPSMAQQTTSNLLLPTDRETDLNASASVLYDSNTARSSQALAASRGLVLPDVLYSPETDFTVSRFVGLELVYATGFIGYDFHQRDTLLNRQHIDVIGGVDGHLGPCQESLSNEYIGQQANLEDVSLQAVGNLAQTEAVKVTADCGRSTGFFPSVTLIQSWNNYSAAVFYPVDTHTEQYMGNIGYRQPAFGSLSLFGSFTTTNYPHRPLALTDQTYDLHFFSGGLTFDRHIGGRIEGVVTLSYTELDPDSPLSPPFHGVTYAIEGKFHAGPRLTAHVEVTRQPTPSIRLNANYSIDEKIEADFTYSPNNRVVLILTGLRSSKDYHLDTGVTSDDLTKETTDSLFLSATYKLSRRFEVTLKAGDEERSANFLGLSYSSTEAGLQFKVIY